MENWQRNTISFTANNETKKSLNPDFSACNPRMQSLQADLKCVQTNWYIVFKIGQDIVVGTNFYLICKDIWVAQSFPITSHPTQTNIVINFYSS